MTWSDDWDGSPPGPPPGPPPRARFSRAQAEALGYIAIGLADYDRARAQGIEPRDFALAADLL